MFRLAPHTADVAIEVTAPDEAVALAQAGLALTALLTDHPTGRLGRASDEVAFFVEAPDHESLAVAWLAELVWLQQSSDLLWQGGGVVISDGPGGIRATARGNAVTWDPTGHGAGVEVKAVTYHDVESGRRGVDGKWHLRVLLDI